MGHLSEARKLRPIIERAVKSLDDNTALEAVALYPHWAVGVAVTAGERLQYGGRLYRVIAAHTTQGDWTPDVSVSLFEVVNETHSGTIDDPIPYDGNMALNSGKFYIQNGEIYLCNWDTINPVYNALAELVGLYVEAV